MAAAGIQEPCGTEGTSALCRRASMSLGKSGKEDGRNRTRASSGAALSGCHRLRPWPASWSWRPALQSVPAPRDTGTAQQLDARGRRPFPAVPGSTTGRGMVKPQLLEPGLARPDRQCRCSGGPITAGAQRRQPRWRLRRDHAAAWSAARAARGCDVLATSPHPSRISS